MSDVKQLIEALKEVEKDDLVVEGRNVTDGYYDDLPETVRKAVDLADGVLITGEGRPNFDVFEEIKKAGFHVGPGETDSFGWLTGVIRTSKGSLVYG